MSNNSHEKDSRVTATFEDGSKVTGNLLIGADGANSIVRSYLLGPEIAALQPLPIVGLHATFTFPLDIAKKVLVELQGRVSVLTYHPAGFGVFFPSKFPFLNEHYINMLTTSGKSTRYQTMSGRIHGHGQ